MRQKIEEWKKRVWMGFVFGCAFVGFCLATDNLMTGNTANPQERKLSPIALTNNAIPPTGVLGTNMGPGNAGDIPKLGPGGVLDQSLLPVLSSNVSTNSASFVGNTLPYSWSTLFTFTTTSTAGTTVVQATAMTPPSGGNVYMKIYRSDNPLVSTPALGPIIGGASVAVISGTLHDSITNATTYKVDVASSAGSQVWTNYYATGVGGVSAVTNGLYMVIHQYK